ncbi:MAG: DUF58 domain-containing protein [Hyphomonadaceae bacterium]|nr:DUF58 domain-containing protein [Hyphomonadaceae bacterium]
MIAPTLRAIILMLAGVPVLLAIAILAPALWIVGPVWVGAVGALMLVDGALGAHLRKLRYRIHAPAMIYIQDSDPLPIEINFETGPLPRRVDLRLDVGDKLEPLPLQRLYGWADRIHTATCTLVPKRRGTAELRTLWARWTGPLGLVQKRVRAKLDMEIPIVPNVRWVKDEAVRLYSRDAEFGIKTQIDRGDGSEFDALREFTSGMDRRAIDWKHSARHKQLLAKEFRTERNHNIVFAFDTGRLMSEPIDGVPKIDRAINAALLLAFVSLRAGDKTVFYSFDARPGLDSGQMHGTRAYPQLQTLASGLDYSTHEANYTLALSQLAARLDRRSLIILFTDFVDTISAELMLENVRRLTDRHLVLFASFQDRALASLAEVYPAEPSDVARAVIADTLLQERELVFLKLQRLGAQVIEARPEHFGSDLISRYIEIKRREMI